MTSHIPLPIASGPFRRQERNYPLDETDAVGEYRYLVVDDDPDFCESLSLLLEELGARRIDLAASGMAALKKLYDGPVAPDIILCDIKMPGMDGIEFLRFLAARRFAGGLILFSGANERVLLATQELARSHGLRALGVLAKPLRISDLVAAIATFGDAYFTSRPGSDPFIGASELRRAIRGGQLSVVYQPKVSVRDGALVGVEALARWRHPEHGWVNPGRFIDAAERTNVIGELSEFVLAAAVRDHAKLRAASLDIKLSVNLSVACLEQLDLPEELEAIARNEGMTPEKLIFEITESQFMRKPVTQLEILDRLALRGFGLALDDFGTGYSSLEQLKRVPFTEIKIDRIFVHGAADNPVAQAILWSGAELGRKLGLTVVAEGVENKADWRLAESLGVDEVQGYYVAKPMAVAAIAGWHHGWRRRGH